MKTLLYFEEYVSPLSKKLQERNDIFLIKIRLINSLVRNFTLEEIGDTSVKTYVFDNSKTADFNLEIHKIKNWIDYHNYKIDYFLNDSEYYLEYANKIARALNLDSLSEEQVRWVRDKVDMKKKFNEIGMKTVDYAPVESKEDIKKFFYKNECNPIIFKPRRGMNSKDVYKITSIEDIDNLNITFNNEKYMVESFCEDHEWSIESLVQDGKVLDSYVTYIPNPTIWASISNNLNCHMTVPKLPNYFKFVPKEFIQQIVDGMELKNGAMTIEVFINKKGEIMPSELGWRLPGCQATTNHSLSYGIDIYNSLIDIAVHKPVNLVYRNPLVSVGDLYLPNKEGEIDEITTLEDLKNFPGFIDGEMFVKKGDYSKKRRVGNDASGWVQVMGINEEDTLRKMTNIFDNFIIKTKEERGKIYEKK